MKTKICSKCKQEKDIILFAKRKDSKDGYRNICKECDNKLHKRYKLTCEHCGKEFYGQATQKNKEHHFCSQECYHQSQFSQEIRQNTDYSKISGKNNYNWKGGNAIVNCSYCGSEFTIDRDHYNRNCNHFCSNECRYKYHSEYISGENNPNYGKEFPKGKLSPTWKGTTPLSLFLRNSVEYNEWRNNILKRANYKCEITHEKCELEIHHLYPFSKIIEESLQYLNIEVKENMNDYTIVELEEIRKEVFRRHTQDVGIAISKKLHSDFHNKYGRKNNTKEQFLEFINHGNTEES